MCWMRVFFVFEHRFVPLFDISSLCRLGLNRKLSQMTSLAKGGGCDFLHLRGKCLRLSGSGKLRL